ncbi:hypothetical protein ACETAC_04595 [Aceticella autotrophica]|uniref:YkoP-like domain-containing protein n=1 Tax=Aceticella autotrophica TaxID=2755338 RepID=A0A975GB72_9THEO|nr:hypothetical protein [Aceticella autotrophica]QSZ28133.1 hypothetical protein ACETAC_04595 [Aceticella autotrophica]
MKNIFKYLWSLWEDLFAKINGIQDINGGNFALRIAVKKYRGKDMTLNDGTLLKHGERYIELHLNNKFFSKISSHNSSSVYLGITAVKELKKSLHLLKKIINENPEFFDINVFMAYSLFYRGIDKLGFEIREIRSPLVRYIFSIYEKLLLLIFHPDGIKRLKSKNFTSKNVIITRNTINNLY